jgi:hypothetical protein
VLRFTFTSSGGSLSAAVLLATGVATAAMVTTAGVSILASDQVAAASDVYRPGTHWQHGGKRAVPAVTPAPDACMVTYVPSFSLLVDEARKSARSTLIMLRSRPLSEAEEAPDNFY